MKRILLLSAISILAFSSFVSKDKFQENSKNEYLVLDAITNISGPDTLNPTTTVQVVVEYTVSSNRDIIIFLQNTNDYSLPWALEGRKSVSAGSGTTIIEFTVPRLPNAVNGYRWGAFITPTGGGYSKKIGDESFVFDVDVLRVKKKKKKNK